MPTELRRDRSDRDHDKALEDSFPASDPASASGITGAEAPEERGIEQRPTGTPTSDRHAAETAHRWEHEEKPTGE